MTGFFLAFEGGDGAGKSTQVALVAERLNALGHTVVTTREPGGSVVAEKIRDVVLDVAHLGLDDHAEALLFAASRAEHVSKTVRPALERGDVVITDRYMDSSIAYQGIARGLGLDTIRDLNLWATRGLVPDLTVVLDVNATTGLERVEEPNRLEEESADFHQTVVAAFKTLAAADPARYIVIPAAGDREQIADQILEAVIARWSRT